VNIFTKRNALIGFLTLKAASRRGVLRRRKQKRSTWKLATLIVLGVLSAGALAVVGAVILRRQREPEHIEGYVVAGEDESPIASGFAETPEPYPATA
jgi:uncharacterized membrane protein